MSDDDSFVEVTGGPANDSGFSDTVVEETTTGWFSRIGESLKGILFGLLLILGAGVLLFWNEGRTVQTTRALEEAAHVFVALPSPAVDPANNGKLVHLTGDMATPEVLADNTFGVSVNAVRLKRKVDTYQWKEEKKSETTKNVGGSKTTRTTYTYTKVWADHLIDSSGFKKPEGHANPSQSALTGQDFLANQVKVGDFNLSRSLLGKLNQFETLPLEPGMLQNLPAPLKAKAQISGDWCFIGNPQEPQVGDQRVQFLAVRPGTVSLIARQVKNTFEPYIAGSGKTVELIEPGVHSAESMFAGAKAENRLIAWLLRVGGALVMFLGVYLLLNPLAVLLDVIPLLGTIAEAGIGLAALVVSLLLSLIVVSIAWFSYRPALSLTLLAAGVALLVLTRQAKRRKP